MANEDIDINKAVAKVVSNELRKTENAIQIDIEAMIDIQSLASLVSSLDSTKFGKFLLRFEYLVSRWPISHGGGWHTQCSYAAERMDCEDKHKLRMLLGTLLEHLEE